MKIEQQIKKKEEELETLKQKLEEQKNKSFICNELKIELNPIKEWIKPYNEIKPPKGWRLIELWELFFLEKNGYFDKLLGKFKGKYNYILTAQTNWAKENNKSSGLVVDRDGLLGSYWNSLVDSNSDGRVAFVRDLK